MTGRQLLVAMGMAAIGVYLLICWTPIPPMLLPPAVLGGLLAPLAALLIVRNRRLARFSRQLPDALELIARALRSGNSIQVASQIVADDMVGPVAAEFGVFCRAQALGSSIDQALAQMCRRIPNEDLQFFADCVVMQREMGGNLSEICEKIAMIVRERYRILSQVQALTGEGRLSGIVLLALPVALFFTIYSLSPDYVELLFTDELGRKMLAAAVILQMIGAITIQKIVSIQV